MKIGLDVDNSKAVKQYTSIPEGSRFSKTEKAGAARLDITGMYTDVNAYGVHGRTTEDLKTEASSIDVATARDYMTVMSNTMSGEDYKKAMEDGFDPADMDPEERETILDHIKAVMAESGQVVAGFNDDLSDELLKDVTGRTIDTEAIKQALRDADLPDTDDNVKKIGEAVAMMAGIDGLSDGSIKYMVENDLPPTVENIYTSVYSAAGDGSRQARGYYGEDMPGYLAKKADNVDWDELKPQVEKAVSQMDIEGLSEEEKLDDARWLIEKGIPVTEEKMENYTGVRSVEFPVPAVKVLEASMDAIADGLTPKQADLSAGGRSIYREAYELRSRLLNASIDREETRLRMSIDANIKLIRSGISIDTEAIEDVISVLKDEEQKLYAQLLGEDYAGLTENADTDRAAYNTGFERLESRIELFEATNQAVIELPSMPAALIGRISGENDGVFTLGRAHSIGTQLKADYEAAAQTYEAVGTEVRRDLGDSITKAFRNVDDILGEMGLDISDENRRAVRILGYNGMAIDEESVRRVKAADNKLTGAIRALTPGRTLELIREGVNPLDMDIDELVSHIHETDHDPKREADKFSKFLYKLEKSGEISDSERASYIGIYRMLNRIERTDHAAIGRIVDSEADMTFGNLLTAMRSSGVRVDAKLDEDFGMLSEKIPRGISITEQIEAAFKDRISDTEYERLEEEYLTENAAMIRESAKAEDAVYDELLYSNVPITPDNIMAAGQLLHAPNELFNTLKAYAGRIDQSGAEEETSADVTDNAADTLGAEALLDRAIGDMADAMDDRERTSKAYEALTDVMTNTLQRMTDFGADSLIDLRSISLMYKQVSLASDYAKTGNYHIPVMIDGKYTDINVRLQHGTETGLVTATMETEVFGTVRSEIRLTGERVDANFITADRTAGDALKAVGDSFLGRMKEAGYEQSEVRYLTGDAKRTVKHMTDAADNNSEAVDTKALYNIAKQFILSVRENA